VRLSDARGKLVCWTDRPLKRVKVNLRTPIGSNALHDEETALRDKLELDPAICWQAIYSRDRRFDGRVFAGVLTTGVYCRPVCPVPLRKPANVRWYPSAASAPASDLAVDVALTPRPARRHGWGRQRWFLEPLN
jgi:hypothetical protein